jgi:magnesium-protoporphyrin IX monomethyl ester (oxidative) cyclase
LKFFIGHRGVPESGCHRCGLNRNRYLIGVLNPCASMEFTRGCPWDCSFCSAWTFYGRSYRKSSAMQSPTTSASIREPNR